MTEFRIAHIGSYPRIGESKDQQRYRRGYGHFERKEISAHAFRDVEQSVIQEALLEQLSANIDEATDGLISWQDPISHFCRNIVAFERTGLRQYFNNNFYYRRPRLTAKPRLQLSGVAKEFQYAQSVSVKPVRAVITGPYTLAMHTDSDVPTYDKLQNRVDLFTELITQEVRALILAGAKIIQIDEPSLTFRHADVLIVKKALEKILAKRGEIKTSVVLALYFGPIAELWPTLQDMPVEGLNLDFTKDGDALFGKMMAAPGTKEIGLGLIDARTTKADPIETILPLVRQWAEKTPAPKFTVTPSSGLDFLPRTTALAKLQTLNALRRQLHG